MAFYGEPKIDPCFQETHKMMVRTISCVCPYKECLKEQTVYCPSPVNVTDDHKVEYEVDYIVDTHFKRNHLEYLIHWKGYKDEDHTWEPLSNLSSAQDAIKDFHKTHPSAPCHI